MAIAAISRVERLDAARPNLIVFTAYKLWH